MSTEQSVFGVCCQRYFGMEDNSALANVSDILCESFDTKAQWDVRGDIDIQQSNLNLGDLIIVEARPGSSTPNKSNTFKLPKPDTPWLHVINHTDYECEASVDIRNSSSSQNSEVIYVSTNTMVPVKNKEKKNIL